ncbi:hypothetical protein [Psychromonas sp.]|uniref:hypothetical protein n=1 Tax=Psychromonas sp. TaxID=1884585 RepID=UPI0035626679
MSFTRIIIMLVTLLGCLFSLPGSAQQAAMQPSWEQWVAERHPDLNCPLQITTNKEKVCHWPGEFTGTIVDDGMLFEMTVQVFSADALVNLPGSKQNWPSGITVNQHGAAVIDHNGMPRVHLKKGASIIRGKFLWQEIPSAIAMPETIGLIKVLRNNTLLSTSINNNQLILSPHTKTVQLDDKNTLKVQVYRALEDGVPMRLTTVIKLFVSGKSREVTIGRAAITDSKTVYLQSILPARLEEDGMLRVQVRPGVHQITLGSRFSDNRTSISTDKISPEWPQYEYLSFIADVQIREVNISGVKSIDTSLVDVPEQWKSYPTYRLESTDTMQLQITTRGDGAAHQNSINIDREIWISFDGKDAISKDNVNGKMEQGWRLDAAKTVKLGRASVSSTPVLITNFAGNEGVEIRSPQINLQAVSSIPQVNNINAVGWQTDAEKLTARIHLPPGWRAVYADGVDGISGTWFQKWNLWDIFWLMILIAAANNLLGVKGALLMTLTLLFTFHEELAPNAQWAVLLAFIAIIKLPIGKYKTLLSRLAILPAAILVITFISITISSLRLAIYPTLEKHSVTSLSTLSRTDYQKQTLAPLQEMEAGAALRSDQESKSYSYDQVRKKQEKNLYQVGENDRVQTGPGIPTWSWNTLYINSSGLVTADQKIRLLLSSPLLTAAWRIINVLLIGLMGAMILQALFKVEKRQSDYPDAPGDNHSNTLTGQNSKVNHPGSTLPTIVAMMVVPILTAALQLSPNRANAQELLPAGQGYPPEYLLKEYENRLLTSPYCLPSCVSLYNGLLEVKDNQLILSFEAFADTDIAMPLPSAGDAWLAEKVTIDNKPAVLRSTQGLLTVFLAQGTHTVTMQGQVKNAEISFNLPLNIHNFEVTAPLWLIDGVRQGVVVNNNIGLTSIQALSREDTNTLAPLPVKSYAIVQRSINLGKEWRMHTRVEKLAPVTDAGSFNITLLPGEQILSAYPVNENGSVNVQIPQNQQTISWQSSLPLSKSINLQADNNPAYSETWTVIPSSIWHVKFDGIKPIKSDLASGQLQPTWKPWPGESLAIDVSRPDGVAGEVFTTEMATLEQQSGKNVQKSKLTLNVRASQSAAYEIILAEGAQINSLMHDSNKMSINPDNIAVVQLHPGEQQIMLEFEKRAELTWRNSSADIKLPGKTVNINIEYHLLRDRWLIYLNGPALGAAMLYWGVLFVILIGALVLPVIARRLQLKMPIGTPGWLLLGLGFSTVNSYGVLLTALFFFVMAFRNQHVQSASMSRWKFNFLQLSILLLTVISVISLIVSIPVGLLSTPEMQVTGSGSYGHFFKYFQDKITTGQLPTVTVYSLPIWFYRIVMLAWSLWVATRLIGWGKWWFESYSRHGAWIPKPQKVDPEQEKTAKVTNKLKN